MQKGPTQDEWADRMYNETSATAVIFCTVHADPWAALKGGRRGVEERGDAEETITYKRKELLLVQQHKEAQCNANVSQTES
jgi:hypothetical protein